MANTSSTKFSDKGMDPQEMKQSADDAGNDLRSTVGDIIGKDRAGEFAKRAQEGVHAFRDRAKQVAGNVRESASGYMDSANEYVRENPIQTILIGFGLGLLVGVLLKPSKLA